MFIHDAVRPFVTSSFMDGIAGVLDAGAQAALPALAVPDTLKRAESGASSRPSTGLASMLLKRPKPLFMRLSLWRTKRPPRRRFFLYR